MFYGYPVEKLCTYQYSLISLLPGTSQYFQHLLMVIYMTHPSGMLQTLDDCGSPPLAARAPTLSRPTSLKTSDHKSMMAFMGLPLDIFGKVCSLLCVICQDLNLVYSIVGCILPAISTVATDRYDQKYPQLALRVHEFHYHTAS
jgi:hypothetical protein